MNSILSLKNNNLALGSDNLGVEVIPINKQSHLAFAPYIKDNINGLNYDARAYIDSVNKKRILNINAHGDLIPGLALNAGVTHSSYNDGKNKQLATKVGLNYTPEQLQKLNIQLQHSAIHDNFDMDTKNITANIGYQLSKDSNINANFSKNGDNNNGSIKWIKKF